MEPVLPGGSAKGHPTPGFGQGQGDVLRMILPVSDPKTGAGFWHQNRCHFCIPFAIVWQHSVKIFLLMLAQDIVAWDRQTRPPRAPHEASIFHLDRARKELRLSAKFENTEHVGFNNPI